MGSLSKLKSVLVTLLRTCGCCTVLSAAYPSYLNVCTYGPPAPHWRAAGLPPMLPELPLDALRHVHDLRPLYSPPKTPNRRTEHEV